MRLKKLLLAIVVVLLLLFVGRPVLFLAGVWLKDGKALMPLGSAGTNDASRLNETKPAEVIPVAGDTAAAEKQLKALVARAGKEHLHISIAGAHHSMGGHTLYPGGITLDMDPFKAMSLDADKKILTVGAGARWRDIIPYLDHRGLAVAVMQSNNDFSVGGSISVNCHGWQNDSPPIASTVEGFRLLLASGKVVHCSRTENRELFAAALGGYGLFGVILEVQLRVVPNEFYVAEAHPVKAEDYAKLYKEWTKGRADVGMAYGRINVAPNAFMEDGIITLLKRTPTGQPTDTLHDEAPSLLKRLVFISGVGSAYGKELRWWLEQKRGETDGKLLSRNQIMNEATGTYSTRDPQATDILQEYFIPGSRLGEFVTKSRPVFLKHHPELMNITVRNVEEDHDTLMRYATEEVFGLVLLYRQGRDAASEAAMQALTRDLIDVALDCGGRYYLPYRAHATAEQFLKAYPQAPKFFALKRKVDPQGIFQNEFYLNYGKAFEKSR